MSNIQKRLTIVIIGLILTYTCTAGANVIDIQKALDNPGFTPDRTSITILDAESGATLAAHNPDLTLNPASCMKILTTVTALSTLGPDYRFKTDFIVDHMSADGVAGTLFVTGTGDPTLTTEKLWKYARELYDLGLRSITKGIIIDDNYFDASGYPKKPGNDHKAFAADTSAVAVNLNTVSIHIMPREREGKEALVTLEPPTEYFKLKNELVTGGKHLVKATSSPADGMELITVTGNLPITSGPGSFRRSVKDPSLYVGSVIKYVLTQNGIKVSGDIRSGSSPTSKKVLYSAESQPLGEIVRFMNKFSSNFVAEQLVKHMGAVRHGIPGSTERGVMVIKEYLTSIGIPEDSYVIENGSGLSGITRISSTQLTHVLSAAYKDFSIRPDFLASLAIVGVDGTTWKWNFADSVRGITRAKTGTLGGVSALAGFTPMKNGRIAAFAILANGLKQGPSEAHKAQIKIVETIAEANP